jgi:hypothetical protein
MWTGLAVCVLLLIVDVANVWWEAGWASRQRGRNVSVFAGKIQVLWTRGGARLPSGPAWAVGRSPTPGIGWWPLWQVRPMWGPTTC